MAIAHSNTQTAVAAGATTTTIAAFTVSGTDAGLIVKVALRDTSEVVTGVAFDPGGVNEAFDNLGRDRNGNAAAELWQLAAPTAKTGDVVVTLGSSSRHTSAVSLYTGVDQTNPIRAASVASNNGTDAAPTVDVAANANETVVDSLGQVSAGPDTATADHTERHNVAATGGGTDTRGASQEVASSGATETMGWTMSDSDNWAIVAGALQEPQSQTFFQTNTGSCTPAGALERQTNKGVDGSLTPAGALLKLVQTILDGGEVTPAGALVTQTVVMQAVAGTATPTGALSKQVNKILSGSSTPTGTVQKQVNKLLAGTLTPSGALQKRIEKVLDGSLTPTGTVATALVIMLQLTGQMIVAGALATLFIAAGAARRVARELINLVLRPIIRSILKD